MCLWASFCAVLGLKKTELTALSFLILTFRAICAIYSVPKNKRVYGFYQICYKVYGICIQVKKTRIVEIKFVLKPKCSLKSILYFQE